ncbi:MAG: hypothetical protein ACK6DI_12840 [Betaproteobacteria bacterium]|jgi:hypothetical protein
MKNFSIEKGSIKKNIKVIFVALTATVAGTFLGGIALMFWLFAIKSPVLSIFDAEFLIKFTFNVFLVTAPVVIFILLAKNNVVKK